ncbi:transcriptional regulator [Mycobacterium numidiamassiliense]|uniref:Transcriptional regulator n=1 Tax=Mycobacterium numidiamassiliense TaxID=1841861 RepID=A0A2U3P6R0_9MYCO|nr:TetR/AcrR family transcriptional regulator [Mycobacterium numidiamassiliense]SPM39442.1 transcriptional regulator [Mycobacterium numidiamassiliense]
MPKVTSEYRAERRAHIMAAARRCFVRDGFHAASMQDLVEEAGMSSGAMYRYFASKDAVIEAIAVDNLDQVVAVLARAIGDGASPQAAIAAVLEFVTMRHGDDGFAAIAVLVWSEALRNPALAGHLRGAIATALVTLSGNAHAAPDGVVDGTCTDEDAHGDATALADVLLCVLPGYLMRLALGGSEAVANIPDAVEKVLTV